MLIRAASFFFIKGAELIFLKEISYKTYIFYFFFSVLSQIELLFFKTFFLLGVFFFVFFSYFVFFFIVFKNNKFAALSCSFLKKNLDPAVFNSLVGNTPWHEFFLMLGGTGAKVLLKPVVGHLALAVSGFMVVDHVFHESGAKALVDAKIHLASEQMKYDFAVKNNVPYTPKLSPEVTRSLLKTLVENNPRK